MGKEEAGEGGEQEPGGDGGAMARLLRSHLPLHSHQPCSKHTVLTGKPAVSS